MKLYFHPNSQPSRTCLAVARQLGVELETQLVDLMKQEQRTPEFLALNPNGKVPALVDGDLTLWESSAIMAYLCTRDGETSLYPASPAARAPIDQWRCWAMTTWNRPLGTLSWNMFVRMFQMGEVDEAACEQAKKDFRAFAALLDAHLDGRSWVAADDLTLADFTLASMLTYWEPAGAPLEEFPNLRGWYGRIEELPAWQQTRPSLPG